MHSEELDRGATGVRPLSTETIEADSSFNTSVPGFCAAGDVRAPMPSVANAIAAGSNAAGTIVHSSMAKTSVLSRR